MLDRIDLHLTLPPVTLDQLQTATLGEPSAKVRTRVSKARQVQRERLHQSVTHTPYNATLNAADLDRVAAPDAGARTLLRRAVDQLNLSARGYMKLRRIARTIADLDGHVAVTTVHFAEALQTRCLDRPSIP